MTEFKLNSKIELISEDESITEGLIHDIVDGNLHVSTTYDDKKIKLLYVGDVVRGVVFTDLLGTAFDAVISDRIPGQSPIYVLSNMSNFEEIQRRNDVRVSTTANLFYTLNSYMLDVDIKYVYEHFDELKRYFSEVMMIDLSGGGLKFTTKEKIDTNQNALFKLNIDNDIIVIEGEIVHRASALIQKQTMYSYGVKFVNIDESKRDLIIRYLFILMRKNRVK